MSDFDASQLFISWQRVREAIGSVETALPARMSAAMAELTAARAEMEHTIRRMMIDLIRPRDE